jgi:hypothetical protein
MINECVISDFRRDIHEICALLEYYAALNGSPVPTFRNNLSVPSSRVKKSKKKAYAALSCSSVPTFRDNLLVLQKQEFQEEGSRLFSWIFTLKNWTDRLSQNVGTELPFNAA